MEVKDKKPKKPIMFYYAIVIVVLILLNTLLVPSIAERSIKEVRYDQFLSDLKGSRIDEVSLDDDTIYYTIKNGEKTQVYKTGRINDQQEVERLDNAKVKFGKEIPKKPVSYTHLTLPTKRIV